MSKAPGDSTLNKLWRQAVLHQWQRDPISGCTDHDRLQCHHYVRRKHYLTRWDWRNGIPLTAESHRLAHTGRGQRIITSIMDQAGFLEHLECAEQIMKKDFLMRNGMSDADFRRHMKRELEKAIKSNSMRLPQFMIEWEGEWGKEKQESWHGLMVDSL